MCIEKSAEIFFYFHDIFVLFYRVLTVFEQIENCIYTNHTVCIIIIPVELKSTLLRGNVMKKNGKRFAEYVLIFNIVIFLFFTVFLYFLGADGVSDAVLPQSYINSVKDVGLDWHINGDNLDISQLKSTVKKWFADEKYDFESVKNNPVVVAVLDSGINYEHELFCGKYDGDGRPAVTQQIGEYDVFLRSANGSIVCKNTVSQPGYVKDSVLDDASDMHGTHVSGIIAALIHELDLEKYIKIAPVKAAYPSDGGSTFLENDVRAALSFALDGKYGAGADVVNMSFSSSDKVFGSMITDSMCEKAVFVAAAGNTKSGGINSSDRFTKRYYPAASPNVVGVMNYRRIEGKEIELLPSSNYGDKYDVCAPGTEIISADGIAQDRYKLLTGTSMASPIVSFGAALVTLKYRALEYGGASGKTPKELTELVKKASTKTIYRTSGNKSEPCKVFDINHLVEPNMDPSYPIVNDPEIRIEFSGNLEQTLGDTHEIIFSLKVAPADATGEYIWYYVAKDETKELCRNSELKFTPPNEVGDHIIKAVWSDGTTSLSASLKVGVKYAEVDKQNITIDTTDVKAEHNGEGYKTGSVVHFELKNTQNIDPQSAVMWYVDDEYVTTGLSFNFLAEKEGQYTVSVKVAGVWLDDRIVISVDNTDHLKERNIIIASSVLSGAVGIAAVVVAVILVLRYRKSKRETVD